tara:strand:- start:140 stop:535 length:396 start_codon:yes stop_codon:yes gene_type:complete
MNDSFKGVIIEESLIDKRVLDGVEIVNTRVEEVTEKHKTPWVNQWTLHTVNVSKDKVDLVAEEISESLDSKHNWYADFKDNETHYIIYRNKIFKVDRSSKGQYEEATRYGISLGIPKHQVDFSPHIKEWKR